MRNGHLTIDGIFVGLLIGFLIGAFIIGLESEMDFSKYTLNCVEQNMTLKDMAFERFTDDYKLRFNDWNSTKEVK
jgi:hypothetical protein